jgi:TPR repeat protein
MGRGIEADVNLRRNGLLVMVMILAAGAALGQAPAAQPAAIDPAVLAKANAGDAAAEIKVAEAYAAGQGGSRETRQIQADYKAAADWYRKAAEQGNIAAEIRLGDLYRDGRGVARDMAQATAWYRKAADAGDAGAQGTLGLLYSVGMGVQQDYVEAYYWLSLASAVAGPNQQRYVTNRQSVGEHITTDQQQNVGDRVAAWKAAHPRPAA